MAQRLLWVCSVVVSSALLAGCQPCVGGSNFAPQQDPIPKVTLADGGLGDPCNTTTQCSAGLTCLESFALSDTYVEIATGSSCTRDCRTSACPQGFVCADGPGLVPVDGGTAASRLCVPGCQTDSDCQRGVRAGTCLGASDGGTDAGTATGACQPVVCGGNSNGSCPTGYNCQAVTYSYNNNTCGAASGAARAAPQGSWCGKL